jgi:hypothetical protein
LCVFVPLLLTPLDLGAGIGNLPLRDPMIAND